MIELTNESTIQELAVALQGAATSPVRHALFSATTKSRDTETWPNQANRERLAKRNVRSVGDALTPEGEKALWSLVGAGRKSMMALQAFLVEKGFNPDWPMTESARESEREKSTRILRGRGNGLSLERAIEAADKQYAAKTGEPVGAFSRKIKENTKAQEDGARLKGRRTL